MKKLIIIDNYDSFTYNLVQIFEEILDEEIHLVKNDQVSIEALEEYEYIILSPGPGLPEDSGLLMEVIEKYKSTKKILGVCLGLQAIAESYGSQLMNLEKVYHGIQSDISKTIEESILFQGLDSTFKAGRYHSWVINADTLSKELLITSQDENGQIMSIEHQTDRVFAVQFHPESIMTPQGKLMLENFIHKA